MAPAQISVLPGGVRMESIVVFVVGRQVGTASVSRTAVEYANA